MKKKWTTMNKTTIAGEAVGAGVGYPGVDITLVGMVDFRMHSKKHIPSMSTK
jgi:hypothetical protein